ADWFKAHPEVKVVARDRAESYESGIRQGAPDAVQVADRFHLMHNVATALEQVFSAHYRDLEALNEAQSQAVVTRDDGSVAVPVPSPPRPPTVQEQAEYSRARRLEGIGRFGWGDHHRLLHAAHLSRLLVVVRFQRAADDRGARDRGVYHARHLGVDAVGGLARADGIEVYDGRADADVAELGRRYKA